MKFSNYVFLKTFLKKHLKWQINVLTKIILVMQLVLSTRGYCAIKFFSYLINAGSALLNSNMHLFFFQIKNKFHNVMVFFKLQVFTFDLFYANGSTISPWEAPNFSQTMQDNDFWHSIWMSHFIELPEHTTMEITSYTLFINGTNELSHVTKKRFNSSTK